MNWQEYDHSKLARAYGTPPIKGVIKSKPEDFIVEEDLGFELTGEGEHVCLQIRKRGLNTADVARDIARLAGVRQMDVSYAGLKDKHALTTQWFSVYLGNKAEPTWGALAGDNVEILQVKRHNRKLRRGCHKGNRFSIALRNITGDLDEACEMVNQVRQFGIPNYYGVQRFGNNNLLYASKMFTGKIRVRDREKRSIYISSARSACFNLSLSHRVANNSWITPVEGDYLMLSGTSSVFQVKEICADFEKRLLSGELSVAIALADGACLKNFFNINDENNSSNINKLNIKEGYRAFRIMPESISIQVDHGVGVRMCLPKGVYATSVLDAICSIDPVVS